MAIKQENRIHAISAEKALKAVYDDADEDAIADILSDLRHLCDAQGRDFAKIDRRAYRNYAGEGGAT